MFSVVVYTSGGVESQPRTISEIGVGSRSNWTGEN